MNNYVFELEERLKREHQINLNEIKLIRIYEDRIDKATKDLQELIDKVNNKTIIGLNEFIPILENIQDELAGDKENE